MTYDGTGRLKTEVIGDSGHANVTTTYGYDAASNRTGKDVVIGSGTAPAGVEAGYWIYTYNASNQLTRSEKRATSGTAGAVLTGITYTYDGDGNRNTLVRARLSDECFCMCRRSNDLRPPLFTEISSR